MGDEISFSRLVIARAATNTVRLFASRLKDAGYVLASLAIGWTIYYAIWGVPRAMAEILPVLVFSIAPLIIFAVFAFLWHLAIAPEELVIEAIKKGVRGSTENAAAVEFNFNPVRLRDEWEVGTLATVLSQLDPASKNKNGSSFSYKSTVLDAMKSGKLKYIKEKTDRGGYYAPSDSTKVKKADALEWMESNGFKTEPLKQAPP